MTSEGLGERFEGDSKDTCTGKFPLVSMGGQAEGLAYADSGARTPIRARENFLSFLFFSIPEDVDLGFGNFACGPYSQITLWGRYQSVALRTILGKISARTDGVNGVSQFQTQLG